MYSTPHHPLLCSAGRVIAAGVAIRTVTAGAASQGLPFAEFVKRGMDPTSIAVMMEDGAACAGLVIAGQPHKPCTDLVTR